MGPLCHNDSRRDNNNNNPLSSDLCNTKEAHKLAQRFSALIFNFSLWQWIKLDFSRISIVLSYLAKPKTIKNLRVFSFSNKNNVKQNSDFVHRCRLEIRGKLCWRYILVKLTISSANLANWSVHKKRSSDICFCCFVNY